MAEEYHCYENGLAGRVNGIPRDGYMLESGFQDLNRAREGAGVLKYTRCKVFVFGFIPVTFAA